ncbi:MAG: diadenylate cyclase CdaA [Clostridia bacterium]|nr:diadenylate cyclase CdaA [Clostridia bacterium]
MRIVDIIDILIVTYVIYKGIKLVMETMAIQLIKGILILIVALQVSSFLNLYMMNYILKNAMQVGVIALVIVFQPELRRILEKMGRSKFGNALSFDDEENETSATITQLCEAIGNLSEHRIGAIIILERKTKIGDIIRTGIMMDSKITAELLINIFVPNTPLHDGAVVIRENRIVASACFLPLTQNNELNIELGTRHRAAIGITETSDAVALVVSEETGKISLALEGTLTRNLTVESLERALSKLLSNDSFQTNRNKFKLWKGLKKQ